MAKNLNAHLEPFRSRRAEIGSQPQHVWDVLDDGARRAGDLAKKTMEAVRAAIGLP
jgi:tryptophanyl-tRNA synthetase